MNRKEVERKVSSFCAEKGFVFSRYRKGVNCSWCILDNGGFHYFYDLEELCEYVRQKSRN